MSLAAQCPHCSTAFKVTNDQLKLQSGLVRCGQCRQIFNGNEQLVEIATEEVAIAPLPIPQEQSDIEQLSFIHKTKTKKRAGWLFVLTMFVLSLLLIGQLMYQFRDLIAATYPASKKTLAEFCQRLGCQIQLPQQIEALSFEADQLQTLPREHTFELSLLLHNRSALTQAWPHVELTLKNAQRQTVLRRVFAPVEYLSDSKQVTQGFLAHQEHAVNLYFELDQVIASDYAVAIFYQ